MMSLDLEGKDQPIQEVADAPAQEDDDRDPMGTWRILDNPGKSISKHPDAVQVQIKTALWILWETLLFLGKTATSEGVDASITMTIGRGDILHKF